MGIRYLLHAILIVSAALVERAEYRVFTHAALHCMFVYLHVRRGFSFRKSCRREFPIIEAPAAFRSRHDKSDLIGAPLRRALKDAFIWPGLGVQIWHSSSDIKCHRLSLYRTLHVMQ